METQKDTFVDQITVDKNGVVYVRTTEEISEESVVLSRKYSRSSFVPEQSVDDQPENVQAFCHATWTPEVISAFKDKIAGDA